MIDWLAFHICSYSTNFLIHILHALAKTKAPLQRLRIEIQDDVSSDLYVLIHNTKTIKWLFLGQTNMDLVINGLLDNFMIEAFRNNTSIIQFEYPDGMFDYETSKEIEALIDLNRENIHDPLIREHVTDLYGFGLLIDLGYWKDRP